MEDVYNEWARPRREHFYLRRLACLQRLAGIEERLGRYEDAARRYFEVLEDPVPQENAVRGLMRYFARRQEYGRVRDQFERLQRELGPEVALSPETQALYQELMSQANAAPQGASIPRG